MLQTAIDSIEYSARSNRSKKCNAATKASSVVFVILFFWFSDILLSFNLIGDLKSKRLYRCHAFSRKSAPFSQIKQRMKSSILYSTRDKSNLSRATQQNARIGAYKNEKITMDIRKGAFGDQELNLNRNLFLGSSFFHSDNLIVSADMLLKDEEFINSEHNEMDYVNYFNDTDSAASRRHLIGYMLFVGGATIGAAKPLEVMAAQDRGLRNRLQYRTSPINKRSGITVYDAEKSGYNVQFVTYLSRFLLSFDTDCQRWWYQRAADIPRRASSEEVNSLRLKQFGAFSASVEVGLQEYRDANGPQRLMDSVLKRYCPDINSLKQARSEAGQAPFSANSEEKQIREIKEARRQIALLFGLMKTFQPVDAITSVLAAIDNATVVEVQIQDPGSGYAIDYGQPKVTFESPEAGKGYKAAEGEAILRPNGLILRIDILNRGVGYSELPSITITPPLGSLTNSMDSEGSSSSTKYARATAKVILFKDGISKGQIERIQLIDPGKGYLDDEIITVDISPPDSEGWISAKAEAVREYEVGSIKILNGGSGYVDEKSIFVYVDPPSASTRVSGKGISGGCIGRGCYDKPVVAKGFARSNIDSFKSFRTDDDAYKAERVERALEGRSSAPAPRIVSGSTSGKDSSLPALPYFGGSSSSTQLLSLLPSGIGLLYDPQIKRYTLAAGKSFESFLAPAPSKPIDPEFGPRGRSPIEKEKSLGLSSYLRFCLSGAICSGGAHFVLTPLDVVKTKVQTDAVKYPSVFGAFNTVYREEGFGTFFTGWAPTLVGFFVGGGILYTATEFLRRYLTELAGSSAVSLEVPIILIGAAAASFIGSFVICPFEAVRIRSVAQPNFADNIVGVLSRIVEEEGVFSLFSAIPVFLTKEIPFAMAKFTVFDLSTEFLYEEFPAAQEDLKLSLLVSLVGGTLGGVVAAIVSNPADTVISEMKKSSDGIGPIAACKTLLNRSGIPTLFTGLGLRMVFYAIMISLQFLAYDSIRFALGIGTDDLKLYLDVLGGALQQ